MENLQKQLSENLLNISGQETQSSRSVREYSDPIPVDVLYFGAEFGDKFRRSSTIVCFDVRSEKFGFINLDENMIKDPSRASSLALFNYKSKLGAHDRVNDEELVLWVLEDAGKHKWFEISSKSHFWNGTVHSIRNPLSSVRMSDTGEIVFLQRNLPVPFYLFYYNIEKNTFSRVNIHGLEEFKHQRINIFLDYVENMKFFLRL